MRSRNAGNKTMRLAYVMVTFPCLRETFVLREINHLRTRMGADNLRLYAYQQPVGEDLKGGNHEWVQRTSYLKNSLFKNLMAMCLCIVIHPRRFFRAMRLWITEIPTLNMRTNLQVLLHILAAFGLARQIRRDGIDKMHAHFATASTMALFAHVLTDIPFSFTAHASGDVYVYSPFLFDKLRGAWRVIAISDYNRRYLELISGYTLPQEKVVTVFNGVDLPELDLVKKENDVPILFTSAAFTEFKGYGTLLEVLGILKGEGAEFRFVAAGGGPLFGIMQRRVYELGLSDYVNFLGPQPFSEVRNWLKSADVFVFPAEVGLNGQRDGMPTAITEALAYGLPVISTHITGIPQQVKDGVNGYLVEERDPVAFAVRLKQLLESPELRRRMGREARRHAEQHFNVNDTLRKLEAKLLEPAGSSANAGINRG